MPQGWRAQHRCDVVEAKSDTASPLVAVDGNVARFTPAINSLAPAVAVVRLVGRRRPEGGKLGAECTELSTRCLRLASYDLYTHHGLGIVFQQTGCEIVFIYWVVLSGGSERVVVAW